MSRSLEEAVCLPLALSFSGWHHATRLYWGGVPLASVGADRRSEPLLLGILSSFRIHEYPTIENRQVRSLLVVRYGM